MAALTTLLSTVTIAQVPGRQQLKFIAVYRKNTSNKPDDDQLADNKLTDYLTSHAFVKFSEEPVPMYEKMVRSLVDWKPEDGLYLARVTPYVFVSASMLGADFEILGTYKNPKDESIYHSYFVVNKKVFQSSNNLAPVAPTLGQIVERLRAKPVQFIYHDKFSTSSYFLPTIFFRNNDIYSMPDATGNKLTLINTRDINQDKVDRDKLGSSELVRQVAADQNLVAAVWDKTMRDSSEDDKSKVFFVQLPYDIPNDLLVCSAKLDQDSKERLRTAIRQMNSNQIDQGDYKTWVDIETATNAKAALSELRHLAEQRSTAVTVKIENSKTSPIDDDALLVSIKDAVRLSKTEFVPWEEDYHKKEDVDWVVERIHSGAIRLLSTIKYTNLDPQEFEISFTDGEDLAKRIDGIIHSRMHRIRYVWPYEDRFPTVLRDVEFPVSPNSVFKVVKVTWNDPKRNDFDDWEQFNATVSNANRFGFQLAGSGFPSKFDPMSNTSYRVVLVRPTYEGRIFTIVTYAFVGLFALAAIGAIFDLRRRAKKLRDVPIVNMEDFKQKCRELAEKYRSVWRKHKLAEADVLWCDRTRLDELIADLKANGNGLVPFDAKKTRTRSLAAQIPILNKYLGVSVGGGVVIDDVTDPKAVSNTQRLGDTIAYLMNHNAFSSFIGEKLEWDALDQIASEVFEPFSLETSQAETNGGGGLIRSDHPILLTLIQKHFSAAITEGKQRACFFNKKWTVSENENEKVLVCTADLLSPLKFNGGNSLVRKLTLRAQVPRDAELCDLSLGNNLSAWLFGKIHRVEPPRNGDGNLFLTFRPTALVKSDDED